jgi:LacI family transcriptional regulator
MLSFPITVSGIIDSEDLDLYFNKRPTIKEVAQAAGVSTQTVSRVINNRPDVAEETRSKVNEVIEKLGYQPSALARSLIQQRSYTLGVVTAGLKYNGPSRTLNGITFQSEKMGYSLLLKELPRFDTENIKPLLQNLLAHHVDGIIWAVPQVGDNRGWVDSELSELSIPIVFLTQQNHPGLSIISFDNYLAGKMATEHLLGQGYRRIGHISGPMDWWESRQRKAGWKSALISAGIEAREEHCTEGNWSSSSGEVAFKQLLSQYPNMDAVFVANDQMALSVVQVSCQGDIAIPQQLGVVGVDGLPETPYYPTPLSTIVLDQYLLGCTAVEEIVLAIEKSREHSYHENQRTIILSPELLVRESSQLSKVLEAENP